MFGSLTHANEINLTPIGAEIAGNKDGSIPSWTGGDSLFNEQESVQTETLINPYKGEQPLYKITKNNLKEFQHLLSDSHISLLKKGDESYFINVYKSYRNASYPKSIYLETDLNEGKTKLSEEGVGLKNYHSGVPFRQPKQGLEVIWNHITRYRGDSIKTTSANALVREDGSYTLTKRKSQISFAHSMKEESENILFYIKSHIISPVRMAGDVVLVHETIDQVNDPRKAWVYSSAQRRIRRIPDFSYDSEIPFTDGFIVADQVDMFNGAPDRYDWKLLGKKELIIPYNNYELLSKDLSYEEILSKGHVNSKYVRYEKHRVWVVEANLKTNARHIYAKRVFYIDEDTWQISIVDYYDNQMALWRMGEAYNVFFYNNKIPFYAFEATYDLRSTRYIVSGLSNEEKNALDFGVNAKINDYTPSAIRRESRN